jgi:hypothetical protein
MNMKVPDAGIAVAEPAAVAKKRTPRQWGQTGQTHRLGYRDSRPDVKDTGIGKNYAGFRIFHSKRNGAFEYISDKGSTGCATRAEIDRFKEDLRRAAANDAKVAAYIKRFMGLCPLKETIAPLAETIVSEPNAPRPTVSDPTLPQKP